MIGMIAWSWVAFSAILSKHQSFFFGETQLQEWVANYRFFSYFMSAEW